MTRDETIALFLKCEASAGAEALSKASLLRRHMRQQNISENQWANDKCANASNWNSAGEFKLGEI